MDVTIIIDGQSYSFDPGRPRDITRPIYFHGDHVQLFGAPAPLSTPYQAGDFTGDVRAGGACNCRVHTIIPHCHGTHTECAGHITARPYSMLNHMPPPLLPATLITITPESAGASADSYGPAQQDTDQIITEKTLKSAIESYNSLLLESLIIRTKPNNHDKITRNYSQSEAPYFSKEAMQYLVRRGVQHLLIDTPSVDRLDDGGALCAHHIFWALSPAQSAAAGDMAAPITRTITELIYVDNDITDGLYLLNLQVSALDSDAVPSRPVLFTLSPKDPTP